MGFGKSLTIDLSLSRLVFLAWCLHLRDRGGDVGCNVSSLCGAYLLETPRTENLLAHPTSFES